MKRRTASPVTRLFRWSAVAFVSVVALVALLDLTPLLRISDVRVTGVEPDVASAISQRIEADAAVRYLGHTFGFSTLLHVDTVGSRERILAEHSDFSDVVVRRDWPRRVDVAVTERVPLGIWCRGDAPESCRFWDRSGARWGTVVPSTGPLLVLMIDERHDDDLPDALQRGIMAVLDGIPELGMAARRIVLPDAEPGGIRLETASKTVLALDALGDVADQLGTLKVFLEHRGAEPVPEVIDLRTPGRVYFKAPGPGN